EKADFMTDDFLITLQHEGYLLKVLMFWFAPLSKPVTLSFFKKRCQIKSELLQISTYSIAVAPRSSSISRLNFALIRMDQYFSPIRFRAKGA
ncbi:MAG: hypothetical protein CMF63_02735, partial [Magnetovibrio sp.]|nr:hypothetical protein [Magnetovibrio sp.]